MTTEPDNRAHNALDALSRQATADPPTRIPSLADLRRRAAQRRRRRNIARLAAPAVILAALGAWAITDTADQPTQLAVTSQPETAPETGPSEELPGPFVWPVPPRGYATLDELVEQFAVEVLGSAPGTEYEGGAGEEVRQSLLIYPAFDPETSGAVHGHELVAVAEPSADGWGFILVGGPEISLEETADGGVTIEFVPPGGSASHSVEIRYADGQITTDTTAGTVLVLPEGRTTESVASVLIRHLDDNGRLNTVSGLGLGHQGPDDLAEIPLMLEPLQEEPVPDFVGLAVNEALDLLSERDYSLDSAEFDETAEATPGTVIATSPAAGSIDASRSMSFTIAAGGPSQSPEDAARDQIVPELAALPAGVRVRQADDWAGPSLVETTEGIWMISRMHDEIALAVARGCGLGDLGNPDSVYRRDIICTIEYAEILLLDPENGDILRAYPFPGVIPTQIYATDDAIYCTGQGDGGLPGSVLCRIDRASLDPTVRVFPASLDFSLDHWPWLPAGWTLDEPVDVVLWSEMDISADGIAISGHSGTAEVDPDTLELLSVTETPSE